MEAGTWAFVGVIAVTVISVVTMYYWNAFGGPVALWPVGPLRRLYHWVKIRDIVAAAQAATLAGEPQVGVRLLGQYGLDLCPSCGQRPPSTRAFWSRHVEDHPTAQWMFVCVCPDCWQPACPIGWRISTPTTQRERNLRTRNGLRQTALADALEHHVYERLSKHRHRPMALLRTAERIQRIGNKIVTRARCLYGRTNRQP